MEEPEGLSVESRLIRYIPALLLIFHASWRIVQL